MLKIATWTSFSFLSLFWFFSLLNLFLLSPEDPIAYEELKLQKNQHRVPLQKPLLQERKQIQKDLFFFQEGKRLQIHLQSAFSILSIQPSKKTWHLQEELYDLTSCFQDKIYQDFQGNYYQQLQSLKSPRGIYTYPSPTFSSEKVYLALYHLPGQEMPLEIDPQFSYLSGYAEKASFSLKTGSFQFIAEHLQAKYRY